ncbi:hypothetical protein DPMN_016097 [Dreissena polymorpha]|uniref:Uncharacterized protein n=1 Tax=Dreissena polymorpha TaxID=45954 RepID=A0A9D4NEY0_DREPO|nr:hypothetical protein DPMN_016097 [Dreissena polymorpha]
MFDVVVVIVSFVVDLVLLKGLTNMKVQVAVLVVSLLLPWRVIRVVNSMYTKVAPRYHYRHNRCHEMRFL